MKDLEAAAYKRGYKDGFAESDLEASDRFSVAATEAEKSARIEAFGAIRRAAEVIREAERLHLCKYEANYIRHAIRAAIGSEKA